MTIKRTKERDKILQNSAAQAIAKILKTHAHEAGCQQFSVQTLKLGVAAYIADVNPPAKPSAKDDTPYSKREETVLLDHAAEVAKAALLKG